MNSFETLQGGALDEARAFVGIKEIGGDNKGPAVEFFQKLGQIREGQPWCAAFVNACAEIAAAKRNTVSPLEAVPWQGLVQSYYEMGVAWRIKADLVGPGDLFLIWFTRQEAYRHIGFVERVDWASQHYFTIEGNSNDDGSREGIEVVRRRRPFHDKDAYLHWGAR